MNSLRLPPDAPETVRKQRKRLLALIALGIVAATAAAARFIVGLEDPFAGIGLRWTSRGGVAPQAPSPTPAANSRMPVLVRAPPPEAQLRTPPPEPRLGDEAHPVVAPSRHQVIVQLAAFRQHSRAISLAKRATRAGFPSSAQRAIMANGRSVFRVRVDRILEKNNARELVAALNKDMPNLRPILIPIRTRR